MKRLVLAGAGHAHARVLLEFAQRRPTGLEIVLVTPVMRAPYSGMVPGWLAGHYTWDECCVDFASLCERAGARVKLCHAGGIDTAGRQLLLEDGSRLPYDMLSLDIGSTLDPPASNDAPVLPMRPLSSLRARWETLLQQVSALGEGTHFHVLMIGGGAAGVESILSAQARLHGLAPHVTFSFTLATRDDRLVPGLSPAAHRLLRRHLAARRIKLVTGYAASAATHEGVRGHDQRVIAADAVLWATGAQAWRWPGESGLAVDARGFIRVGSDLRSLSHPDIFASGDCCAFDPALPKAGVYAVRMGPVLAHNLRAVLEERALQAYRPQRRFLVLIGTGGPHAVAAWGALAWQGAWVWRWKQRIDRRFVARHSTGSSS